jgi:hypothetical protein
MGHSYHIGIPGNYLASPEVVSRGPALAVPPHAGVEHRPHEVPGHALQELYKQRSSICSCRNLDTKRRS